MDIKKGTFYHPTKVLLRLINAKIMPTASEMDFSRVKVCMIYAFFTHIEFALWKIMLEHMARVSPFGACRLFYPSMITRLLKMHYVDEEYHYDRVILVSHPIKAFDVTLVIDPPAGSG